MKAPALRVFISAEEALGRERDVAIRVVGALQRELAHLADLQPVLVDEGSERAITDLRRAAETSRFRDIVVRIVSSRLGPSRPRSAGEETAERPPPRAEADVDAGARPPTPCLLVYRRTGNGIAIRSEVSASLKQKKAFSDFMDAWFGDPHDPVEASFQPFDGVTQLERMLRHDIAAAVRRQVPGSAAEGGEADAAATWSDGSPYVGLESFDADRADVFMGRRRAVGELTRALIDRAAAGCAFVLVVGASGCGKSSLIDAGVVPALVEPGLIDGVDFWRRCRFRPRDAAGDLFRGLAEALLGDRSLPELKEGGVGTEELADLLREAPRRADIPLRMVLRRGREAGPPGSGGSGGEGRLVLVVDQLEGLFTADGIDAAEREAFVAVLAALARSGQVWVIAALRSEFVPRLDELPELAALTEGAGQYRLMPPTFAELGQIIRGPARAAGLQFEIDAESGERLDDVLHRAAVEDPGALPLVQYALKELHDRIRADDRVLTFHAYRRLGGLEGLVARRAEEVYAGLDPALQEALPALLRNLITVSVDDDAPEGRVAPLEEVRAAEARSRLVDALVEARLVTTDLDAEGRPVAALAYRGMLPHWPRLTEWLADDRNFLRARATLANAASYWRQQGRNPDFLLPAGQSLAEGEVLPEEWRHYLDVEVIEYVEASMAAAAGRRREAAEAEAQRRRRVTWMVAILVAAIAAASAAGGYLGYQLYSRIGAERQQSFMPAPDPAVVLSDLEA